MEGLKRMLREGHTNVCACVRACVRACVCASASECQYLGACEAVRAHRCGGEGKAKYKGGALARVRAVRVRAGACTRARVLGVRAFVCVCVRVRVRVCVCVRV